jgi:hypothetical protein
VPAHAEESRPVPSWLEMDSGLPAKRDVLESRWNSVVRHPFPAQDPSTLGARPSASLGRMGNIPGLIDLTATGLAADSSRAYVRPHFTLGASSDTLRSFLQAVGIHARHCVIPLMKMHSTFAGGSSRTKASISASCSTE